MRLCGKCIFNFIRNWQTVFQSGCKILHAQHQYMRVSAASHSCNILICYSFLVFLNFSKSNACEVENHCGLMVFEVRDTE